MKSYTVTFTIKAPFLTKATGAIKVGLDAQPLLAYSKNAGRLCPVIPGSLVKGHLNEVLERAKISELELLLKSPKKEDDVSGSELLETKIDDVNGENNQSADKNTTFSETDIDYEHNTKRSCFHFSPNWICEKDFKFKVEQRISLDKDTGVVDTGSLVFEEVVVSNNSDNTLEFTGNIYLSGIKEKDLVQNIEERLENALSLIPALGSNKRIGFGRLAGVCVKEDPMAMSSNVELKSMGDSKILGIALQPLWDMCFIKPHRNQKDTVATESYIPGAALKAALINLSQLANGNERTAIEALLDKATVTHALPRWSALREQLDRPVIPPLSLGFTQGNDGLKNYLFDNSNDVPIFKPDWKNSQHEEIREKCGWADVPKTLRVRHKHDKEIHASEEEHLFLEETLPPNDNVYWLFNIHFAKDLTETDRTAISALQKLLRDHGLSRLGRKATPAKVSGLKVKGYDYGEIPEFSIKKQNQELLVICLQTPARLFSHKILSDALEDAKKNNQYPNDTEKSKKLIERIKNLLQKRNTDKPPYEWLSDCYEDGFNQLIKRTVKVLKKHGDTEIRPFSVTLEKHFAQQFFQGGTVWAKYLFNRMKNIEADDNKEYYQPEIMSREGSIFVFSFDNKDKKQIEKVVAQWRHLGLPQLSDRSEKKFSNPWLKTKAKNKKLRTPWTRANGYGQVIIKMTGE